MRTSVTAIIVAQTGQWLDTTLEALSNQTLPPNRLIGVVNGTDAKIGDKFNEAGADQVILTGKRLSFGAAVAAAEQAIPAAAQWERATGYPVTPGTEDENVVEWLWLLTEDSAPEPKALRSIVSSVMRAPSVTIAGPKLIDWDAPERIVELGQSLTQYGNRWLLRRQELDQQQYDHLQDTLGVGPIGMLIQREVFADLGGFDPSLPVYDDGLDLCVRARLAGHRVIVAPKARVRVLMQGIAGPKLERSRRTLRRNHYQARISHLHRRITYANPVLAFFMWLLLPLLGVFRMGWALLREQPGNMFAELRAALRVFFNVRGISRARKRLRKANVAGWGAVKPLRADPKGVRTALMIDKEAILAAQGRERKELHFISTGGLGTLLAGVVLSAVLMWWLFGQNALSGGVSAPLSPIAELWRNTRLLEGIPADPFNWVLAVLGSLTFFDTSLSLIIFMAVAIPLAAMGGWLWGAQFTESTAGRVFAGMAWATSPVVLGSLDHARIQTVLLAVILPWLLIAATRAHQSWALAGTASLLAAVALACAPVLLPVAIVIWIIGLATRPLQFTKIFATAIAPAALFFPLIWHWLLRGQPLFALRDPGINHPFEPGSLWHLLIGFPVFGLEGWSDILQGIGLGNAPTTVLVGVLVAPLAILALAGLYLGKVNVTIFSSLLGGMGLLTAFVSSQVSLAALGNQSIALWTGSGLTLYWIALITLAASGSASLGKAAAPVTALAVVACLVAVAPLLTSLASGQSEARQQAAPMPAIVQAAGNNNTQVRTLELTTNEPGVVSAEVITGAGTFLDEVRSAASSAELTGDKQKLAELTGALASEGSASLAEQLISNGISFVLLRPDGDTAERSNLQEILDAQGSLAPAGQTEVGTLWRVNVSDAEQAAALAKAEDAAEVGENNLPVFNLSTMQLTSRTVWIVQAVVLLAMFLLALPTGEVTEQPVRRKRRKKVAVRDTEAAEIIEQRVSEKEAAAGVAILGAAATLRAEEAEATATVEKAEAIEQIEAAEEIEDAEAEVRDEATEASPEETEVESDEADPSASEEQA